MSDVIVVGIAVGFGVMGLGALVNPRPVLVQFGVPVETVEGRTGRLRR